MQVYIFDSDSGEFLRGEDIFLCPVTGGPLLPPNGTFIPPPQHIPPSRVAVFRDGRWVLVDDFRGQRKFDPRTKQFSNVTTIGPIPQSHVIVDGDTEREYMEHPDHYVATNTAFSKRSDEEIAAIDREDARYHRRNDRDAMLSSVDWKVCREQDAIRLNISEHEAADTILHLARYRQYLRDFTKQEDWWDIPIPSLEEFIKEREQS
jgi:hypothetical protein